MRESHQSAEGRRALGNRHIRKETWLECGFIQVGIPAGNPIRGLALITGCTLVFPVLPSLPASLPGISSEDETPGTSLPSLCRLLTWWDPGRVAVAGFGRCHRGQFCVLCYV